MFQNLYKIHKFLLVIPFLIFSCKKSDFDDASKRNENWAYWIDADTGKASWIRVKNKTTVENGEYYLFYTNGKIFEKGELKNGKPVDTIYRYDENENIIRYKIIQQDTSFHVYLKEGYYIEKYQDGSTFQKGTITNNDFNDDLIRYYPNGKTERVQEYKNKTGIETMYYESGQVSAVSYRKEGKLDGVVKMWYENGNLAEVTHWKNGLQDGLYTIYYESGALKNEAEWKDGKSHGKNEFWYENGKRKSINYFDNDVIVGALKEWNEKGQLIAEENYINGKLNGKGFRYYDNGVLSTIGYFIDDKRTGVWEYFNENGKLIERYHYENGTLVKEEVFK